MFLKILLPVSGLIYLILKSRARRRIEPGPVEGMVLYPRQNARFAHTVTSVLVAIFILEFISHPVRDSGALLRLLAALALLILVDGFFWLKLKNEAISYDQTGLIVRDGLGRETRCQWDQIREIRSSGTGIRHARYITLHTAQGRRIRINEKSGGLERFRRFLEEHA